MNKDFYQKYRNYLRVVVVMQDQDSNFLDGPYSIMFTNKIENIEELKKDLKEINYEFIYGDCVAFDSDALNAIGIDIKDIDKYWGDECTDADSFVENEICMYDADEDEEKINEKLEYLGYSESLDKYPFIKEEDFVKICQLDN